MAQLFTTMDTAKMIGQALRNGYCFQQYAAMHPLVGIILQKPEEVMYGQGKRLNFTNLKRINGLGPEWNLDFQTKTATDLVLASNGIGGEGEPRTFDFADATVRVNTGWAAYELNSVIYGSDMKFQSGKELVTEDIQTTEANRMIEAGMVKWASKLYGTGLPAKNTFGGLVGAIDDGLTTALRQAAYTDRNGTYDGSAYRYYGATLDSQDSAYANHRSYVKPWTTTIPTVPAMCNTKEKVQATTNGNPNQFLMGVANYQTQRDSVDTTNGAIITQLNTEKQDLGITGFSFRNCDFIMDPDIDLYCSTLMFGIDPRDWFLHMDDDPKATPYKKSDVLRNAYVSQQIMYFQATCARRRTQVKWVSY